MFQQKYRGPIPAGTGETLKRAQKFLLDKAYPRRHGGNGLTFAQVVPSKGLSPQARGKHCRVLTSL